MDNEIERIRAYVAWLGTAPQLSRHSDEAMAETAYNLVDDLVDSTEGLRKLVDDAVEANPDLDTLDPDFWNEMDVD